MLPGPSLRRRIAQIAEAPAGNDGGNADRFVVQGDRHNGHGDHREEDHEGQPLAAALAPVVGTHRLLVDLPQSVDHPVAMLRLGLPLVHDLACEARDCLVVLREGCGRRQRAAEAR